MTTPEFDIHFQGQLDDLLHWRRDVRHFHRDPVSPDLLETLLKKAMLAPSVGYSQPWRWVIVETEGKREEVRQEFERCNAQALQGYSGEAATLYSKLKLSGMQEAPVHVAVFFDATSSAGKGLGQRTMPETRIWSVMMAIHTLWLSARAVGLGMGWVSILNPDTMRSSLEVPANWSFLAYLCIGWPIEQSEKPLLEQAGWEARLAYAETVFYR
ncbi:MAG: 5,6-dimethylbenzimidazole synthase [Bryobacteraceae bacterium]|nr:5,6-dimethylbenzimidazole synthase [Bryobacteraceae bacterium]